MKLPASGPGLAWLLAIALLSLLYFSARAWVPAPAVAVLPDAASAPLESQRLRAAARPVAVFLGTSLTACAIPFDDEWSSLPERFDSPWRVLRFARTNGQQEDFVELLPTIKASDASIVLVEAEMMLRQRIPEPQLSLPHRWALQFRTPIRQALWAIESGGAPATLVQKAAATSPGCPNGPSDAQAFDRRMRSQRQLRSAPWTQEWLDFIRDCKRSGRKLVLVSLGRSSRMQRSIDPDFVREFQQKLDAAAKQHELELWVFDSQRLPDSDFSDGVHLSPSGRAEFTHWLAQRLASEDAGH